MPLFLDIHRNVKDATPASIRAAHMADLEAQETHGARYLKYWYDQGRGMVVCLVDAPDKEACEAVHRHAHGMAADEIINVETEMIAAFLGDGGVDDIGAAVGSAGEPMSAFRTIVFTDIVGSTELGEKLGDAELHRLVKVHDRLTEVEIHRHHGRVVKNTGDGILASFSDASLAVTFAQAVQRAFAAHRQAHPEDPLHIRIGMSAGEPISRSNDLFGSVVNLAARICARASADEIMVAPVLRELCRGKGFSFESLGETELKGFAETVALYRVDWDDQATQDARSPRKE
jgi:class 3 adenylate cyclase